MVCGLYWYLTNYGMKELAGIDTKSLSDVCTLDHFT